MVSTKKSSTKKEQQQEAAEPASAPVVEPSSGALPPISPSLTSPLSAMKKQSTTSLSTKKRKFSSKTSPSASSTGSNATASSASPAATFVKASSCPVKLAELLRIGEDLDALITNRQALLYQLMFLEREKSERSNLMDLDTFDCDSIELQTFCSDNQFPIYQASKQPKTNLIPTIPLPPIAATPTSKKLAASNKKTKANDKDKEKDKVVGNEDEGMGSDVTTTTTTTTSSNQPVKQQSTKDIAAGDGSTSLLPSLPLSPLPTMPSSSTDDLDSTDTPTASSETSTTPQPNKKQKRSNNNNNTSESTTSSNNSTIAVVQSSSSSNESNSSQSTVTTSVSDTTNTNNNNGYIAIITPNEQQQQQDSLLQENTKKNMGQPPPSVFAKIPPMSEETLAKAQEDARIIRRIHELQANGVWKNKQLHKLPEPPRPKVHWDYLLEEMSLVSEDFARTRKLKNRITKMLVKDVNRYHLDIYNAEERIAREEDARKRRVSAAIAREVKRFWQQIGKLIDYKDKMAQESALKVEREKQLDEIVNRTEQFSSMIAEGLRDRAKGQTKEVDRTHYSLRDILADPNKLSKVIDQSKDDEDDSDEEYQEEEEEEDEDESEDEDGDGEEEEEDLALLEAEGSMPIDEVIADHVKEMDADMPDEEEEEEEEEEEDATVSQPTGFTLKTTKVKTKVPFLMKGTLREYQHIGLDWLVSLYEKNLNGVLADEMGLGKTIQTISLLAYLAVEKGIWGPHLVVVPSSVLFNWEMEFKRWCPAFKVLTYHGSQKERKELRKGWSKPNSFHVCIASYSTIITDQLMFRRRRWTYMVLDEAHSIKNFKSQRWQTMLHFNAARRLLLTGTPLQNNLMELWSLMHFLMPDIFASHREFSDWFANPMTGAIEGGTGVSDDLVARLHTVLRPFLLRRLKKDVEKQMPGKHTHIVPCYLSRRQRYLYEEFINAQSTQTTLATGNYFSIVNILMQLRKVCNHPDLFEPRPIISPFPCDPVVYETSGVFADAMDSAPIRAINLDLLNLQLVDYESRLCSMDTNAIIELTPSDNRIRELPHSLSIKVSMPGPLSCLDGAIAARQEYATARQRDTLERAILLRRRSFNKPLYGRDCIASVTISNIIADVHKLANDPREFLNYPDALLNLILTPTQREMSMRPTIQQFVCLIPKTRAPPIRLVAAHPSPSKIIEEKRFHAGVLSLRDNVDLLRESYKRQSLFFPDKKLIQYDCGKLQALAKLLRNLKSNGDRALIFTQWTRMLDVFESFLNLHGYTYLRLDGSTKVDRRQYLAERFNRDNKIFLFILSTRSGGLGLNLTGANTVIFYDTDWNPSMDAQAQDRCHRIGQTREVNIYRLITLHTIEENILKKSNQKRQLDDVVIQGGEFTTDFFKNLDFSEIVSNKKSSITSAIKMTQQEWENATEKVEDESDVAALRNAQKEQAAEFQEFDEDSTGNSVSTTPPISSKDKEKDASIESIFAEELKQQQDLVEDYLNPIQKFALRYLENMTSYVNDPEYQESADSDVEMKDENETESVAQETTDIVKENNDDSEPETEDNDALEENTNGNHKEKFPRPKKGKLNHVEVLKQPKPTTIEEEADKDILFFELSGINSEEFQSSLILFGELLESLPEPDEEQWYLAPMQEPIPENLFEQVLKDQDEYYHQHYHYLYPPSPPTISFESFAKPSRSKLMRGKIIKQTANQYVYSKQFTKEKEKEKRMLIKKKKEKDKREKMRIEEERKAKERKELKKSKEKSIQLSKENKKKLKSNNNASPASGTTTLAPDKRLRPDDIIITSSANLNTGATDEFEELAENVEMMINKTADLSADQMGDDAGVADGTGSTKKGSRSANKQSGLFSSSRSSLRKSKSSEPSSDEGNGAPPTPSAPGVATAPGIAQAGGVSNVLLTQIELLQGPAWHPQEDAIILDAVRTYGQNWDLVAYLLQHSLFEQVVRFHRSKLQCAERYKALFPKEAGLSGSEKKSASESTSHDGPFPYSLLDCIRKSIAANKLICRQGTVSLIENKGIHMSHNTNVGQPTAKTPSELSMLSTQKFIKERALKQQQQQQQAAAQRLAAQQPSAIATLANQPNANQQQTITNPNNQQPIPNQTVQNPHIPMNMSAGSGAIGVGVGMQPMMVHGNQQVGQINMQQIPGLQMPINPPQMAIPIPLPQQNTMVQRPMNAMVGVPMNVMGVKTNITMPTNMPMQNQQPQYPNPMIGGQQVMYANQPIQPQQPQQMIGKTNINISVTSNPQQQQYVQQNQPLPQTTETSISQLPLAQPPPAQPVAPPAKPTSKRAKKDPAVPKTKKAKAAAAAAAAVAAQSTPSTSTPPQQVNQPSIQAQIQNFQQQQQQPPSQPM